MAGKAETEMLDSASFILGVVGHSGSGKTTLIEKLIPLLIERGLRVNVIKSTHLDVQIEPEHKDSARFRRAGASDVMLSMPARYMLVHELRGEMPELPDLAERMQPADITLVEGYKSAKIPRLEVFRHESGQAPLYPGDSFIIAVASDQPQPSGLPQRMAWLDLNRPDEIRDWIFSNRPLPG